MIQFCMSPFFLLLIATQVFCSTSDEAQENVLLENRHLSVTWYLTNDPAVRTGSYEPGLHIFLKNPSNAFKINRKDPELVIAALYKNALGLSHFITIFSTITRSQASRTVCLSQGLSQQAFLEIDVPRTKSIEVPHSITHQARTDGSSTLRYHLPYGAKSPNRRYFLEISVSHNASLAITAYAGTYQLQRLHCCFADLEQ